MLNPLLTEDQSFALEHTLRWGAESYPVRRRGRSWWVEGIRGCGRCPQGFRTKAEAVRQWQRYLDILLDYTAGRLPNPAKQREARR